MDRYIKLTPDGVSAQVTIEVPARGDQPVLGLRMLAEDIQTIGGAHLISRATAKRLERELRLALAELEALDEVFDHPVTWDEYTIAVARSEARRP